MGILTIGIDIGGTNFRIGTVDENDEIQNFEKNSSRIFDNGNVVETMADAIKSYMARYGVTENVCGARSAWGFRPWSAKTSGQLFPPPI